MEAVCKTYVAETVIIPVSATVPEHAWLAGPNGMPLRLELPAPAVPRAGSNVGTLVGRLARVRITMI